MDIVVYVANISVIVVILVVNTSVIHGNVFLSLVSESSARCISGMSACVCVCVCRACVCVRLFVYAESVLVTICGSHYIFPSLVFLRLFILAVRLLPKVPCTPSPCLLCVRACIPA